MKTVLVSFPVIVQVQDGDSIDSIMFAASEMLETTPITPIITTPSGKKLVDDEELNSYKLE